MSSPATNPPQTVTTVTVQRIKLKETPVDIVCPNCAYNGSSRVDISNGPWTWVSCLGICLVGGWLGCCLIPFCTDCCKDVDHYCPKCNHFVGRYRCV